MAMLQAHQINKFFLLGETQQQVLFDISLTIDRGEFLALTGQSGSGKSTLMNILGCLDVPSSGIYLFEDKNVGELTPDELALIRNKKVGFVFQHFNLLPDLTAMDNVALPQLYANVSETQAREKAKKMLELVELGDKFYHYPYQLSGGQRQRVAIARALVNEPDLILADEPTGNLDSKTGNLILDIFKNFNQTKKVTVIIVTHNMELAQQTNRIIKLLDGRIIQDESVKK